MFINLLKKKKIFFYIFAIIYHDIVDLSPLLFQLKVIEINILVVELIFVVFTAFISIYAYLSYKKLEDENPGEIQNILGDEENGSQRTNSEGI